MQCFRAAHQRLQVARITIANDHHIIGVGNISLTQAALGNGMHLQHHQRTKRMDKRAWRSLRAQVRE